MNANAVPRSSLHIHESQPLSNSPLSLVASDQRSVILPGTQSFYPTSTTHNTNASIRMPRFEYAGVTHVPLTSLAGAEFVKAWLEIVKLHAFLWNHGIKYGDPSLWNVKYDEDLKSGVLIDYDFSISPKRQRPRVPDTDRTGTIPFMAIGLLSEKYWNGEIERGYRHELEAFIWMLVFVFLRYRDGNLSQAEGLDSWTTSDHHTCAHKKVWFGDEVYMRPKIMEQQCQPDFKDHWQLGVRLVIWLIHLDVKNEIRKEKGDDETHSLASVWPGFVERLRSLATYFPSQLGYLDKLVDDLGLAIWIPDV